MTDTDKKQRITEMFFAAETKIKSANLLLSNGFFDDAIGRAYYAAFLAVNALMWYEGKSFRSHGQVLGEFNRQYVASGLFPKEFGRALYELFDERREADYGALIAANEDQAKESVTIAQRIVAACREYLAQHGYGDIDQTDTQPK